MNICFDRKCLKGLVRHKVDFQGYRDIFMEKNQYSVRKKRQNEKKWLVILFLEPISLGGIEVRSYIIKENHIGSVVCKIQTDRQTHRHPVIFT